MEGDNIHQRISSSLLRHAGLHELIGSSKEEMIEIAVRIASEKNTCLHLRKELRSHLFSTDLFNPEKSALSLASPFAWPSWRLPSADNRLQECSNKKKKCGHSMLNIEVLFRFVQEDCHDRFEKRSLPDQPMMPLGEARDVEVVSHCTKSTQSS